MLNQSAHSQNDRYWPPVNGHELVECKKTHGEKAKAHEWALLTVGVFRCLVYGLMDRQMGKFTWRKF